MVNLFLVDVGYACYGIETEAGYVITAPPIARWMVGKPVGKVRAWLKQKGAKVVHVV